VGRAQTVYNWTGGNILTALGTTNFNVGDTLNIVTTADHDIATNAVVTNGVVNWIDGNLRGGGSLTNNGQWFDSASAQINAAFGGYAFVNSSGASYTKTAGTTTFNVGFNNNGAISVTGGTLNLNAGGTFASGASIGSTGGGLVQLLGGTLTLNGAIAVSNFTLAGGDVAGSHTLTGTLNWQNGTLNSSGVTTLAAGGTLTLSGAVNHDFNGRTIANDGTIRWTAGSLRSGNGGSISNFALWEDSASGFDFNVAYGGGATFVNQASGTYLKTGGTTTLNAPMVNYGTVTVSGGTLNLNAGGTFHDGSSVGSSGGGVVQLTGGTLTAGGAVGFTATNFKLSGGTVSGNMTFLGTSEWIGTDFNTSGTATIGAGATMLIANAGNHDFNGHAMVNNGTVNWSAGDLRSGGGGTFTNHATVLDSAASSQVANAYGGGVTFINGPAGSYLKTTGTTTMNVPFVNRGNVTVSGGTLSLNGGGVFHDGSGIGGTGGGVAQLTGGTLTAGGTAGFTANNFRLSGGQVSGNMTFLGVTEWVAGDFNTPGTATIGTGATLNITGGGNHDFNGHGWLNQGTVNWQGGHLRSGGGGTLTNQAQWNDTTTGDFTNAYGGGATFVNAAGGTYTKSAGTTSMTGVNFTNQGTVSVTGGTLSLIDATLQGGSSIGSSGAGVVQFVSGTLTASGSIQAQRLQLSGGTLTGTPTFLGTLSWLGTSLNSTGVTTIGAGATLTIASGANHDFSGHSIVNQGTVAWTDGDLRSGNGGSVSNQGVWNDSAAAGAVNGAFGGGATFVNASAGTYRKLSGNTTFTVPVTNLGLIDVAGGTLALQGGFTQTGTVAVAANALLTATPSLSFDAGSTLRGAGGVSAGTISLGGATYPGAVGTVGSLALTGVVVFLPGSTVEFDLGGTVPGTQHDQLSITGPATLGGTLAVRFTGGFQSVATAGMTFELLGATALIGSFANVPNGGILTTADGLGTFRVNYGVGSPYALNQVVLSNFVAVPEPETWALLLLGLAAAGYRGYRRWRRRA